MLTLAKHKYMRTRAVLFLLPLFVGLGVNAHAQYKKRYNRSGSSLEIKYGLKIGWHLSNFTGDEFIAETNSDGRALSPPVEYRSLSSFHGGGYMELQFSDYFSLQPELYFGVFGSKLFREADLTNPGDNYIVTPATNPLFEVDVIIEQRLFMIQLPVIAKIGLSSGFDLDIGPMITLKRSEENRYDLIGDSLIRIFGFTGPLDPDKYKALSYGGLLGLSYQMENGFNMSFRYSRTFNNINKNERLVILADEPKNSLSAFLVAIGYTFSYKEGARKRVRLSN